MAGALSGIGHGRLVVLPHPEALGRAAAEELLAILSGAIAERGGAHVALSGGRTPERLYRAIAGPGRTGDTDWSKVRFFWSDERGVPPGHAESNYGLAARALFSGIGAAADRLHRMEAERADPARAAAEYEALIRRLVPAGPEGLPRFDVILLGLGADGHTASLFPGSPALEERGRLVVEAPAPAPPARRMTFTLPLLNAARHVLFLVAGAEKAEALRRLVVEDDGATDVVGIPARRIRPLEGEVLIFADADAATG